MGAVQRRERERTELREAILGAARKIVLKDGFDALSMRKIAEAVEYAPGTIYLYFESRDAIAYELCRSGYSELLRAFAPAASITDPLARLVKLGEAYIRFGLENEQTYRMIFMENPAYTESAFDEDHSDEPGPQALAMLVGAFEELKADKRLKRGANPVELADAFWCAMHGVVSLKISCKVYPRTSIEQLTKTLSDALLRGVLRPLPSS